MSLEIGRQGQLYLKKEAAYGVSEALTATEAMRHIDVGMTGNRFNRSTSTEKKQSPGPAVRFDRRRNYEFDLRSALLRPSGVLNTLPECDPILECGFGSVVNVSDADGVFTGTPTTTTGTTDTAGALAVGDAVVITIALEPAAKRVFVRWLTDVSGSDLTWAPALPSAPAAADVVRGCVTYQLTTALALSLSVLHALPTFSREALGVGINTMGFQFDANEEPMLSAGGPNSEILTDTAQATPAGFTTVGGQPPSGLVGELLIDDTAYLFKRLDVSLDNGLTLRNDEYGETLGSDVCRTGRREITASLEAWLETEATLYDPTEAGTDISVHKQTGFTEGNIVALYMPRAEPMSVTQDDPDTPVSWTFELMALESADGANDEMYLAIA